MRIRSIQTITALALTATLSTGLSACSGNGKDNSNSAPSATEHSSESAANDSPTNSMTSTAAAAVQDSFSATIDGQPFTIDQPIVACATEGDATSVNVTATNSETDYFTTVFGDGGGGNLDHGFSGRRDDAQLHGCHRNRPRRGHDQRVDPYRERRGSCREPGG